MSDNKTLNNTQSPESAPEKKRSGWRKAGIVAAWSAGGILLLIVILLCAATWYLTPSRLTEIINREASKTLNADVKTSNVRFTIWSTFPHFCIEMDSLRVISRSLNGIPDSTRAKLPGNPDYLASTSRMKGGINILKLLKEEFWLRDIEAEDLDINLVAVSDSVANYYIWQETGEDTKVPYFTAKNLTLSNPRNLRYYSAVTNTTADIALSDASLSRKDSSNNSYRLALKGKIDAQVEKLRILSGFPFTLGGDMDLRFDPFGIRLSDYDVKLGNISGKVNMALEMGKEIKLNDFSYRLDNFNIMRLLDYLPKKMLPNLSSINADIIVNATARLTTPYNFSSSTLPSAEVDFNIPDGDLSYTLDNQPLSMRHIGAAARLIFDGKNPDASYLEIPGFNLQGEGMDMAVKGKITDLMGEPTLRFLIQGEADAAEASRMVASLRPYGLKGKMVTDAIVDFKVSDLKNGTFENINMQGEVSIKDYALKYPASGLAASGNTLTLTFGGKAGELSDTGIDNSIFDLNLLSDKLNIHSGKLVLIVENADIATALADKNDLPFSDVANSLPINLLVKTGNLSLNIPGDTVQVGLRNFKLDGNISADKNSGKTRMFSAQVSGEALDCTFPDFKLEMKDIRTGLDATLLSRPIKSTAYKAPAVWRADSADLAFVRHSSEFLTVQLPKNIRSIMEGWETHLKLGIGSGRLSTPSFPADNTFRNFNLEASFDSIALHSLRLRSRSSALNMNGSVGNLRQFLSAPASAPAPLRIRMNLDMDTIQINQLAGAYARSKGGASLNTPVPDSITASDTITMLIPRNIIADIHASAKQTRYMNLHLYDLSTGLDIRDGKLNVNGLRISSDFGNAGLDFLYNTSNVTNLGMEAKLGFMDINVVNFFKNFHTLLLMMPQMRNLSGILSAEMNAKLLIFPDMYINVPSVWANLFIHGRDLKVHQDPFIRKITKKMLIRDAGDIHIAAMDVHASVHDNLLELYPFNFEFDNYRLNMGGLNNFDGKLYYHIGIEKSPVPFPFGINIVGMFHDPEIRFGGATYKNKKGTEITSSVMEHNTINLMQELKTYLREFLRKAAESENQQ